MTSNHLFRKTALSARTLTTRQRGKFAESEAARWLRAQGFSIIACNFHSRYGEIDIIGRDGEHLVFVEVRFRDNTRYGGAAATVDSRKQKKLILTAQYYLSTQLGSSNTPPCRFDVVALEQQSGGLTINWYKAAFE